MFVGRQLYAARVFPSCVLAMGSAKQSVDRGAQRALMSALALRMATFASEWDGRVIQE
jgi:hypothetical protein